MNLLCIYGDDHYLDKHGCIKCLILLSSGAGLIALIGLNFLGQQIEYECPDRSDKEVWAEYT